jgi:GNAT superfamily N-acetyltransferase
MSGWGEGEQPMNAEKHTTFTLRLARDNERDALDDICFRSKAHWGYDADFMENVRQQIRVHPDAVKCGRVWVAVDAADRPLGVVEVDPIDDTAADITLLFIAPENLRRGIGRALYEKAVELARQLGVRELLIDSDPQAAAFYASMGATRIGAEPTGYQGRLLPKFSVAIEMRKGQRLR